METADTIRAFWFGSGTDDKTIADERARMWWSKNSEVDREIRQRFEASVAEAANHELDHWSATVGGRLALILLTDQFPRHIYRGTSQAFSFDTLARHWSREGIRQGEHERLRPVERVFFFLPLEHSESMDDQEQSVALYEELVRNAPAEHKAVFEEFLRYARLHRDVIKRFGRFPHRNRILGRESTPEELAALAQGGLSF